MKRIIKRMCSAILVLGMIVSVCPAVGAAETKLALPKAFTDVTVKVGTQTPFKPAHMYGGMQNPPDFTWPAISGANKYDLIVCRDEALTDVAYSKEGLNWHYYNFPNTFEPGTYYWAIRYYSGKNCSDWSVPRRFRIDPDAYEFTVPDLNGIVASIPKTHPRIFFSSEEEKAEFLKKGETEYGKIAVESVIKSADGYIRAGIEEDPGPGVKYNDTYKDTQATQKASSVGSSVSNKAKVSAMAYLFTGDTKYKDYSIEVMMKVSDWDYIEGWTSYKWQDQPFFAIMAGFSYSYDWLYNEMTPAQRSKIGDMLKGRFDVVKDSSLSIIRACPYNSHIWSYMPNYGLCAMVLMHDYPEVNNYFGEFIQLWVPNYVPMSNEDGGWSKGTAYWTYAYNRDNLLAKVLSQNGYLNMYNKAWHQNQYLWAMYMMPKYSYGSFGDESNRSRYENNSAILQGLNEDAYFTKNPVAAWARDQKGNFSAFSGIFDSILSADAYLMEPKEPIDYPNSWTFVDQGITAMHSELVNDNKISMYFRAGKYGSYNHMHADQNAFFIEANGERLAAKGGWYDSYHSAHDSGFTRKTYAHNSITVDVGQGQMDDSMDANGNTEMFVTQSDFDAVVGNATDAYAGNLDKFVRSIIYVRPDSYIVVDDLKAAGGGSNFEWWLNTVSGNSISLHDDGKGANISAGTMALDARVHYPEKVTGYYSNIYSGPDLVNYPTTERYASQIPDERIWFETENLEETKMITTINVHEKEKGAKYVKETETADYVKLEFEDGTVAVVNKTTDNEKFIDAGDVIFNGTAAVYNEDSIMLVGGKELTLYGTKLIEADNVVTVVIGKGQLDFSSNSDYSIKIYTGNEIVPQITSVLERDGKEPISADVSGFGVEYGETGEVTITAQKGHYATLTNGTPLPGEKTGETFEFEIVINGESKKYQGDVFYNYSYDKKARADVEFPQGTYILVDQTEDISIDGATLSKTMGSNLSGNMTVAVTANNQRVEIKTLEMVSCETELDEDYAAVQKACAVYVEAENYDSKFGAPRNTSGLDYLVGISQHNNLTDKTIYTVEIPEDGYYDFAIRCAVWQDPLPERTLQIDGKIYVFTLPNTGGWGGGGDTDFDAVKIHSGAYLTKGTHTFEIGVFKDGAYWNYDWIGFIKK